MRKEPEQWLGAFSTVARDRIPPILLSPGDRMFNLTTGAPEYWNGTVWLPYSGVVLPPAYGSVYFKMNCPVTNELAMMIGQCEAGFTALGDGISFDSGLCNLVTPAPEGTLTIEEGGDGLYLVDWKVNSRFEDAGKRYYTSVFNNDAVVDAMRDVILVLANSSYHMGGVGHLQLVEDDVLDLRITCGSSGGIAYFQAGRLCITRISE